MYAHKGGMGIHMCLRRELRAVTMLGLSMRVEVEHELRVEHEFRVEHAG